MGEERWLLQRDGGGEGDGAGRGGREGNKRGDFGARMFYPRVWKGKAAEGDLTGVAAAQLDGDQLTVTDKQLERGEKRRKRKERKGEVKRREERDIYFISRSVVIPHLSMASLSIHSFAIASNLGETTKRKPLTTKQKEEEKT